MTAPLRQAGDDVLIRVKAVPGASRDQIAGVLGDRLKIRIAAPPEGGKANSAICALVSARLGVRGVRIESGHGHAEKVIRVEGAKAEDVATALEL